MSFIRYNHKGEHVPIPDGSQYYWYNDGDTIGQYTVQQFGAMIGSVVFELDCDQEREQKIVDGFREYFNGWDPNYGETPRRRERGEVFSQCLNVRIETVQITRALNQKVVAWVKQAPDAHS